MHRDAELADVGEQLHDLRVSGAEGDHWSLCCQRGGNVVKTLIAVNRRDSQRERETGLSKSQLPHSSHAQQAGSSVSQETPHWSSFDNTGPLLATRECHCQAT